MLNRFLTTIVVGLVFVGNTSAFAYDVDLGVVVPNPPKGVTEVQVNLDGGGFLGRLKTSYGQFDSVTMSIPGSYKITTQSAVVNKIEVGEYPIKLWTRYTIPGVVDEKIDPCECSTVPVKIDGKDYQVEYYMDTLVPGGENY